VLKAFVFCGDQVAFPCAVIALSWGMAIVITKIGGE